MLVGLQAQIALHLLPYAAALYAALEVAGTSLAMPAGAMFPDIAKRCIRLLSAWL